MRNILLVLSEFISKLESARITSSDLATKLREQIVRIDEAMNQGAGNGGVLPGLGESLMRALPLPAPGNHDSAMVHQAPRRESQHEKVQPSPSHGITSLNPLDSRPLASEEATMISIDDAFGSAAAPPAPQPQAQPNVDEAMPPHDALSALQLGPPQSASSFTALGFAAQQGMFDFGMAPMDDALIGEFLRYWPAHGALGESIPDGTAPM